MSQLQANIEHQLLNLPRNERAQIALHLIESLEPNFSVNTQAENEKKWLEESQRRLQAYQRGEMQAYSVEEVIADLEHSIE